ncbi:MAG TPA: family 43 glycosylhydrolase [Candidatus Limivivens merdigallinarum]|uniref:Family 43 glycosylhydrolase n=1 Tax=Candidatus Limivivens merdigallinarum TaxID=2840859 RepID=A0A9D1CZC5_9FIRM|nr:family 43 glycosylhydrolase [Candidatus Limivivens merdigallinarum]
MNKNPIIKGYYADPDIRYFDGRYYIYPTTDGGMWKGTVFHCFVSENLADWKDCGVVFDVARDSKWADDFAWAPTAACKNGRYYLYYCANQQIGVAVANQPEGPFQNLSVEEPLLSLSKLENGVKLSQMIDPYFYSDPSGKNYLLFGNGENPAIAELEDDMATLLPGSMRQIAFIGQADFTEAVMVFYKDGLYHFTWSCGDTRSENYHVNYGVAESVFGPVKVVGTILEQKPEKGILAPGHHSIVEDPGTGEYWIAYHRFSTSLPEHVGGEQRGYFRELCLDRLEFDNQGLIVPVCCTP